MSFECSNISPQFHAFLEDMPHACRNEFPLTKLKQFSFSVITAPQQYAIFQLDYFVRVVNLWQALAKWMEHVIGAILLQETIYVAPFVQHVARDFHQNQASLQRRAASCNNDTQCAAKMLNRSANRFETIGKWREKRYMM